MPLNLFSTVIGGMFDAAAQQQQNQFNSQMARYQNEWNRKFWYEQQEYNNPTNTMQRLTDAGINPRAYNQLGQFANASQPPTAVTPENKDPLFSFSQMFNQLAPLLLAEKKTDSEVAKNQSEIDKNKQMEEYYDALENKTTYDTNFRLPQQVMMNREKHQLWRFQTSAHFNKDGYMEFHDGLKGYQGEKAQQELKNMRAQYSESFARVNKLASDVAHNNANINVLNREADLLLEKVAIAKGEVARLPLIKEHLREEIRRIKANADYTNEQKSYMLNNAIESWVNTIVGGVSSFMSPIKIGGAAAPIRGFR